MPKMAVEIYPNFLNISNCWNNFIFLPHAQQNMLIMIKSANWRKKYSKQSLFFFIAFYMINLEEIRYL